jgi:lipopolysaccharide biosynthesis protein
MQVSPQVDFLVFVHVHYRDIWEEMAYELCVKIDRPFGLVLTRPRNLGPLVLPDTPFLGFSKEIEVENRGRDILPFLKALRSELPAVDIGLKLHAKRSPHRPDGVGWRAYMCDSLLSSDSNGLTAYRLLDREKRIGLLAPEGHFLSLEGRLALNRRPMSKMMKALCGEELPLDLERRHFAAGSMFWFRRSALVALRNEQVDRLFPTERGQLDGTAAHAIERLFALLVEREGFVAAGMEAARPILAQLEESRDLSQSSLRSIIETSANSSVNPFILPIPNFWRRQRTLFLLAHLSYVYLPRPVTRVLRAILRRVSA